MSSHLEISNIRSKNVASKLVSVAPLKIIPSAPYYGAFRAFTSSYGGGMLQGDNVHFDIQVKEEASLLLEAQGNQHIYMCEDESRKISQIIDAKLEDFSNVMIVPQPTVMHEGARFFQTQTWDLKTTSNLILIDAFHGGRSENDERFDYSEYQSDVIFKLDGEEIYLDKFYSNPSTDPQNYAARFGEHSYMLNIYSFGEKANAIHEEIVKPYQSQAKYIVEELKAKAPQNNDVFCASVFDDQTEILTTRSFAPKRKELENILLKFVESSEAFFGVESSI